MLFSYTTFNFFFHKTSTFDSSKIWWKILWSIHYLIIIAAFICNISLSSSHILSGFNMPFKRPKQIFTIPRVHTTCLPTVAFIYEDQLLSSKPPKQLLCVIIFVCVCVYQINRILLDEGLSVNSLLTYITKELEVSMDELSKSSLIIQGLYQLRRSNENQCN